MELDHKAQARFEAKITVNPITGCWEWTASQNPDGYGQFKLNGRREKAHRVAHVLYIGEIPKGMCVLHRCDNPSCVNPEHLFLGTHADNVKDKVAKGRAAKGEKNGRAKLTKEAVLHIRKRTMLQREYARLYGVDQTTVSKIQLGKKWSHGRVLPGSPTRR